MTILRVSWRNLVMNKIRLVLTVVAVTIGVAFVSGTFVLSDTMDKAFTQLYDGLSADTDVVVRSTTAFVDARAQAEARPMDEEVLALVADVEGVALAEGSVTGFALILDAEGEPLQPAGAPTLATNVDGDPELAGDFVIREGRVPRGPEEVTLDAASATGAGYHLGDRVTVVLTQGTRTFTMVGTTGFGESDSLAGATLTGFDLASAQELLGRTGQLDQVSVRAEEGADTRQVLADVAAVLPAGTEAVSGDRLAQENTLAMQEGLAFFSQILLVLASVSLLVGSFVIWNTFSVLLAQRRREIALLRAVGARRRQVLLGILGESVVIGTVSAVTGLLAGIGLASGLRALLGAIGIELPSTANAIEPRTVLAAFVVGVGVTVAAAIAPALAATRATPIEALRESDPASTGVSPARRMLGWVVLGAGLAGLVLAAVLGDQRWGTALAAVTAFVGLVVVGPALAQGVARVADHGRRGGRWHLAARTVARAPRRAAATALALTIGVTVVSAVAVTATSMRESVTQTVSGANRADFIMQPTGSGISPAVATTLRERDDLDTVVEMRFSGAVVQGRTTAVVGVDPAGLGDVVDLSGVDGVVDLAPGTVLVGRAQAEDLGVRVGDRVSLTYPETGPVDLVVSGLLPQGPVDLLGSGYVVPLGDFASQVTSRLDSAVLVSTVPGADAQDTEEDLVQALADHPDVAVLDPAAVTASAQASLDQIFGLVTALLLLAVVIAVLGIVNTLMLSVLERTRELGLLRAVGATRAQVRAIVRGEAVLMSGLGAVTGISLGTLLGIALSRALAGDGITQVSVPVAQLLLYLLVATAVGVLAAIGPARRAGRVDILRAVVPE